MSPILLIAEREFRTYVATLSFWLSLAIAPLLAGAVLLFSGGHQLPAHVRIEGGNSSLMHSASLAVVEAGRLEGKAILFAPDGARLVLSMQAPGTLDMTFASAFPLSPEGRAVVGHIIERDSARRESQGAVLTAQVHAGEPSAVADTGAQSRFAAMMMLWLTLTGSLGMLLQAVVRERANRALESLLAAAQGWQIVAGKMLGVGAVSLLVLIAWGGTGFLLSLFVHGGPLSAIAAGFSDPLALLRDALIYLCAFAFYGAITVTLGAVARDSASAQNAVRPMFVLLLAAFFVALLITSRHSALLSWLTWVPPFTPFLLLIIPPGSVAWMPQVLALGLLLLASIGAVLLAARLMTIASGTYQMLPATAHRIQPVR